MRAYAANFGARKNFTALWSAQELHRASTKTSEEAIESNDDVLDKVRWSVKETRTVLQRIIELQASTWETVSAMLAAVGS